MERLKSCPFCGGEVEVKMSSGRENYYQIRCYNLQCNIRAATNLESSKQRAITAWNTRVMKNKPSVGEIIPKGFMKCPYCNGTGNRKK